MAYADGFTPIRNDFLVSQEYTALEKLVLVWLASKPADWIVCEPNVRSELNLGRDAARHVLRDLRAKGALSKHPPRRSANGTVRTEPSRLAIRDSIRALPQVAPDDGNPGVQSSGALTKEGKTKEGTNALSGHKGPSGSVTPPPAEGPGPVSASSSVNSSSSVKACPFTARSFGLTSPPCSRCGRPKHEGWHECPNVPPMCDQCRNWHWLDEECRPRDLAEPWF